MHYKLLLERVKQYSALFFLSFKGEAQYAMYASHILRCSEFKYAIEW
jgi:hypothetical protein